MKKIIFIFCLTFFYTFNNAQTKNEVKINYIFTHNVSKNDTSKVRELYHLLINDNKSFYLSNKKMESDSIKSQLAKKNDPAAAMSSGVFSFHRIYETVQFNKKENEITTYKHIAGAPIAYKENAEIKWILHEDSKKINDITLNLATCDFGDRKWFAWYNKDYPLNEGPYKFKNLPGLIFELYDAENKFSFQLSKIQQKETSYQKDFSVFKILPKEKYIAVINNYIYNPLPQLTKLLTAESKREFVFKSIEKHKNIDYIEKQFD